MRSRSLHCIARVTIILAVSSSSHPKAEASADLGNRGTPTPTIWVTQNGSGDLSGADANNSISWPVVRTQLQSNTTYRFIGDVYGGMPLEANSLDSLVFDGASAGTQPARFRNDLPIDIGELKESPIGVFSFEIAGPPPSMVWGYRQDTPLGDLTGVTFDDPDIASIFTGRSAGAAPRFAPWFGHLHPTARSPDQLEEGQWTFTEGRVFVRPPVAASLELVAQNLRRIGTSRGVYFKNCTNLTIRHFDFVGFGNPGTQNGAVYTSGCRDIHLEDIIAYDSGYRAFNLEGSTGDTQPLNITAIDCIAAGDTIITGILSNNPFVVYNTEGCAECNASFRGGGIAAYPWLDYHGRPLLGDPTGMDTPVQIAYRPAGFYTHASFSGLGMGGIDFDEFFVVSFCQPLNEKHGLSMVWSAEGIGRINRAELATPVIGTDPGTYPIRFRDSVFYCVPGLVQHIVFDRCRFVTPKPRGGLQSYSGRINTWFPAPESNTSLYIRSSELILQQLDASQDNGLFKIISASNTLCIDLCTIVEVTDASQFRIDSTVRSADGATIRIRGCLFTTTKSDGFNQHFLYRPNGASVQTNYDQLAWSGIDIQSCWFHNYDQIRFNERFGTLAIAGLTYADFLLANTAGSASKDFVSGEFIWGVDPELVSPESGMLDPQSDSPLFDVQHALIPDLAGLLDFNGNPYTGRYGAWQAPDLQCPGDADGNGSVNLDDLNIVLTNFGQQTPDGDVDNDGIVDLNDLNIVLSTFGSSCGD